MPGLPNQNIYFFFYFQCLVFSLRPVGDTDKKQGRFSVETALKRQKYVVHGFEARALKHIPKLMFKICERLLVLSNTHPQYSSDMENFTKSFIAYKFDAKGGRMNVGKLANKNNGEIQQPKNDRMATRRSSNR